MTPSSRFTDKFELKIGIEAMTGCTGSCAGCVLTPSERRTTGGLWSPAEFARAAPFLRGFLREHLERRPDLLELAVNLGQGDHFFAGDAEARGIVDWLHDTFEGRATAFITVSAVSRRERFAAAAERWYEAALARRQPLMVDLIFDPTKAELARFADTYAANIETVRAAFGSVDMNINVGPDTIRTLTPAELHAFALENGLEILTLNLVPTLASAPSFAPDWTRIQDYLAEFLDLWEPSGPLEINYGPGFAKHIEAARSAEDPTRALDVLAHELTREIYLDHAGGVHFQQAGFGDTPLGGRFGFAPLTDLDRAPRESVLPFLETAARRTAIGLGRAFLTDPRCAACPYRAACQRGGVAALRNALAGRLPADAPCPTGVLPVLTGVDRMMAAGKDLASRCYERKVPYVQRGLPEDVMPEVHVIDATHGPVRFPHDPRNDAEARR